jgi:hypothetical protein
MPNRSAPMQVMLTPGDEYLDATGRVWRVDKTGTATPTNSFVYRPKKAPMSAFGSPPAEPPPPPQPDPLQQATGWVEAYIPGGWWLVAAVGAVVAWQVLVPEPDEPEPTTPKTSNKRAQSAQRS